MGMFDSVLAVNISDPSFKHNNVSYQTKSMDCELSEYVIFNNQLWLQYDGSGDGERFEPAKALDVSCELNIYTEHSFNDKTYWIEYTLTFDNGMLANVEMESERLTKDCSDLSGRRPSPKSKSSCVTLDFRGVDNQVYESFHNDLNKNIDRIRDVIGDPKAEVVYQVKDTGNGIFSLGRMNSPRWIHSVAQDIQDFNQIAPGKLKTSYSDGNSLTIFLDETHNLKNR